MQQIVTTTGTCVVLLKLYVTNALLSFVTYGRQQNTTKKKEKEKEKLLRDNVTI